MKRVLRFFRDESGPTAVEYAVMLAMIIGVCIAAITIFGAATGDSFEDSSSKLTFMGGSSS
jgi:pilus assembly protein Flp/PilA